MDKPGSNGHSRFHQGKQILEHNALLVPCLFSGHLFVFGASLCFRGISRGAGRESRPEYLPDRTNPSQNSL